MFLHFFVARINAPSDQAPTPTENRSVPLRSATLLQLPVQDDCFFPLCSSPFCRYSFSLLCPSPPPFHRTPRPDSTISINQSLL